MFGGGFNRLRDVDARGRELNFCFLAGRFRSSVTRPSVFGSFRFHAGGRNFRRIPTTVHGVDFDGQLFDFLNFIQSALLVQDALFHSRTKSARW